MQVRTRLDDQLRERPEDPDRLQAALEAERRDLADLREALDARNDELDRTRLGRVLNRLADHYRLAGRLDEAHRAARQALEIWDNFGRRKAAYLARLRLAKIKRRRGRLEAATDLLDELVEASQTDPLSIYRDFALELRGICRWEAGDTDAALDDLDVCRRIRKERGSQRQVARTERVIERIEDPDAGRPRF